MQYKSLFIRTIFRNVLTSNHDRYGAGILLIGDVYMYAFIFSSTVKLSVSLDM